MPLHEISSAGGSLLSYVEYTSPVTLTATTEATATTIVTAAPVVLDGATPIVVKFFSPQFQSPGGGASRFSAITLYQSLNGAAAASQSAFWGVIVTNLNGTIQAATLLEWYKTPSAGIYEFSARGYGTVSGGVCQAGAGGTGNYMPGFIRVEKVV